MMVKELEVIEANKIENQISIHYRRTSGARIFLVLLWHRWLYLRRNKGQFFAVIILPFILSLIGFAISHLLALLVNVAEYRDGPITTLPSAGPLYYQETYDQEHFMSSFANRIHRPTNYDTPSVYRPWILQPGDGSQSPRCTDMSTDCKSLLLNRYQLQLLTNRYVLYYPQSAVAESVMDRVREHVENTTEHFKNMDEDQFKDIIRDLSYKERMNGRAISEICSLFFAVKRCLIEPAARFRGFDSKSDAMNFATKNKLTTTESGSYGDARIAPLFAMVEFHGDDVTKMEYTIIYNRKSDRSMQEQLIHLQDLIDTSILQDGSNDHEFAEIARSFKDLPVKCESNYPLMYTLLSIVLPFFLGLSFYFAPSALAQHLVVEKTLRLREYLAILGVSRMQQKFSWLFFYFLTLVPITVVCSILLRYYAGSAFGNTDLGIIFLMFLLYSISLLSFALLLSSILMQSDSTGLIYFGYMAFSYLLAGPFNNLFYLNGDVLVGANILSFFFPYFNFRLGLTYLFGWQENGLGSNFDNARASPFDTDDYGGIGIVLVYLAVNSITFLIMSWYIENAYPGEYGLKQPFYFPFLKSYWFPNAGKTARSFDRSFSVQSTGPTGRGIRLSKLTKEFDNGMVAVDNLTVEFAEGQITALLGENGAGKTTTMSMIVGVLEPTKGTIYIGGERMTRGYDSVSAGIGYVPQYDILYPSLTVQDHINFYAKILGLSQLEVQERSSGLMEKFGLNVVLQSKATTLSGGQKRKFSLMCTLLGSPQCVVLDEPTSGVDPFSRRQIWDAILSHRSQSNSTVIVSTHQLDEAEVLSDDIAIVSCGELRCFGQPIDLKDEFSLGYKLYVTSQYANNEEPISTLVTSKIPTAKLQKSSGVDLIFTVPRTDAQGASMVELLAQLERSAAKVGIAQFGVAEPTMDEVFFNAIQKEEIVDEVSSSSGQTAEVPVFKNSTFYSLLYCFIGLIKKRFFYFIRSYGNAVVQFVIPLVFLVLLFVTTTISSRLSTGTTFQDIYVRHTYYENNWFVDINPAHGQLTDSMRTLLVTASQTGFGPTCGGSKKSSCMSKHGDAQSVPDWATQSIENRCQCDEPCKNERIKRIETMTTPAGDVVLAAYAGNMSDWIIAANDTLDGLIYGGFSMLEDDTTEKVQLFSDRLKLTSPVPSSSIMIWSSSEKRPATLNALNNVILRAIRNNDAFIKYSAKAEDLFVSNGDEFEFDSTVFATTGPAVLTAVMLFGYLSLAPIRYLLYEKDTGLKEYQLSYGVQYFVYILSNAVFDFLGILLIAFVVVIIMAFVPNSLNNFIQWIMFVIVPYFFAVIPYCTFLSIIFRRFKCVIIWITAEIIVFTVIGLPTVTFAFYDSCKDLMWDVWKPMPGDPPFCMDSIEGNLKTAIDVMQTLDFILPILPLAGLSNGIYSSFNYYAQANMILQLKQDDEDVVKALGSKVYGAKYLGKYWLLAVVSGFIFTTLSILIETVLKNRCGSIFSRKRVSPAIQTATQDPDVTAEEQRVQQLYCNREQPLVAKELTKFYNKAIVPAVNQVSFAVDRQQCFGLLGVNGAGKTTTFKMLTSSIDPSSGSSSVMGHDTKTNRSTVAARTGYCPQENVLLDELTVRENLDVFALMAGLGSPDLLINTIMEELGLTKYSDRRAGRLSGGNKRKVQMALALMEFRPVIFLDEPTTGLDPGARRNAWRLIDSAVKKRGCAVVLTSHSMQECEELCSRLGIMVLGRIQCLGSVQYLKDKLGNKYTFKFRIPPGSATLASDVKNYIAAAFEGCATLSDVHETLLEFEIPRANLARLSYLFEVVLTVKSKFNLTSFTVSQATLEDVFIKYAERQLTQQMQQASMTGTGPMQQIQPVAVDTIQPGTSIPMDPYHTSTQQAALPQVAFQNPATVSPYAQPTAPQPGFYSIDANASHF